LTTYLLYSFEIYPNYQQACECLMKKTMLDADCWPHGKVALHQHFLDNEQVCISDFAKHLSPNILSISV